jgi:hypothetical protein
MSDRLFLKPVEGRSAPSPDHAGSELPASGDWVNASIYWSRRIADGDVTHDADAVEPAEPVTKAKRGKSAASKEA